MKKKTILDTIKNLKMDYFKEIVSTPDSPDPKKSKPNPWPLLDMMKKFKVKPEETLYIGDTVPDIKMAQKAGVEPVIVLTGDVGEGEAQYYNVQYVISDVTKLPKLLEKIEERQDF